MLFISGKGDGNIRYFEMTDTDPYLHFISHFSTTVPQKACDFFPKRFLKVEKHEIARALKVEASAIVPVSFKVPRKIEAFQADLFPDDLSGAPTMDSEKWIASDPADTAERLLMSLDPEKAGDQKNR